MGDRANFGFKHGRDTVFLYGHWAGNHMLAKLANALDKVRQDGRLSDSAYGTRIAMSQLIGDDWNQGLGWGITVNELSDNEHSVPVVDWNSGTVTLYDYDWKQGQITEPKFTLPVDRFIQKYAKSDVYI